MANKAYKFRIYPNREQKTLFAKTFGCVRFIYNKMLDDKIKYYEKTKKKRPTFTSCFPRSSILYFKKFTNIPQPLSKTDLPKCSACDIAFISRSSIQTQSYASAIFRDCLCKKSLRWAATFSCILATRIRCFPRFWEPFCIFESFRCSLFNFCSAFL